MMMMMMMIRMIMLYPVNLGFSTDISHWRHRSCLGGLFTCACCILACSNSCCCCRNNSSSGIPCDRAESVFVQVAHPLTEKYYGTVQTLIRAAEFYVMQHMVRFLTQVPCTMVASEFIKKTSIKKWHLKKYLPENWHTRFSSLVLALLLFWKWLLKETTKHEKPPGTNGL